MSDCLTDSALYRYFDHGMGSLDHAHLDRCAHCLDRVTARARAQASRPNRSKHEPLPGEPDVEESTADLARWVCGRRDRYRLLDCENIGSFGELWLASDSAAPPRRVAIKLLHRTLASNPLLRQRFKQEQLALQTLADHQNIVGLVDAGEDEGRPFLVTEYLEGQSLQQYLAACRQHSFCPPLATARDIFFQLCAAVGAAHRCSCPGPLLHRDIKPSNVMLLPRDGARFLVKLIDFGLVQLGARCGTRSGQRLGTPAYMAPEQALGIIDRQKPWTDVFALVALLVELLTLDSFARRGSHLWQLSLRGPGPLVSSLAQAHPALPDKLWKVIERALSEDGSRRYSDAVVLAEAVRSAWPGG